MIRRISNIVIVLAGLAVFASGSALACSGNYCTTDVNELCVQLETVKIDSCCLNLDTSGRRCWTCTRDDYWCMDGDWPKVFSGPTYNCHSPGSACN